MITLALLLVLTDPLPPPRPKCTVAAMQKQGGKCVECTEPKCADKADAGYAHRCTTDCKKAPCSEVWCTEGKPLKPATAD